MAYPILSRLILPSATGLCAIASPVARSDVFSIAALPPALPWVVVAFAAWLLTMAMVISLIILSRRWRTAFEAKDWLLLPSSFAAQHEQTLQQQASHLQVLTKQFHRFVSDQTKVTHEFQLSIQELRDEFSILRRELALRQQELKDAQLGLEHHHRRPLIMRIVQAVEISRADAESGTDPKTTLKGIATELSECLEDHSVSTVYPEPNSLAVNVPGFDTRHVQREPTADQSKLGLIARVDSPAYVVRGPQGREDILRPARFSVYSREEQ